MSKTHGKIQDVSVDEIVANDCSRHFELLRLFDINSKEFENTEYYKFSFSNGKSKKTILDKIENFRKLYQSIKDKGYDYQLGYIVLTIDGCRLDGSHRASIVAHLKKEKFINVKMMKWEEWFSKKKLHKLYEHIQDQKDKYNAN